MRKMIKIIFVNLFLMGAIMTIHPEPPAGDCTGYTGGCHANCWYESDCIMGCLTNDLTIRTCMMCDCSGGGQ
ncbi:MAG: hypothetical protein K9I99_10480 [Melioribacteraceae bacterium]|nr:hypothetical protein [Melioribacteraceae bacterium]